MQLFSSPSRTFRERAIGWRIHFPKLLLVIFLVAGTLLALFAPSAAEAMAGPISEQPTQISQLNMIDQQHGWAFNQDQTRLYATQNGPEHWTDVTPSILTTTTNNTITTSFFLNATHGYLGIVTQDNVIEMLSTQDGGKTWQTTSFPTLTDVVNIHQITFTDPQHGWISFNAGSYQPGQFNVLLSSTSNGGKSWQTLFDTNQSSTILPMPFSLSCNFAFTSPLNGWATGIWLAGDVYLYSTHDGGKTWSKANVTPIKGAADSYFTQGYGPYWQNNQSGTLFVNFDTSEGNGMPHVTAYQTHDGGKTWILGPSSSSTSYQEFVALNFINAQDGASFGFNGQGQYVLHSTSTAGQTWHVINPTGLIQAQADYQVVSQLTFLGAQTGWVIIKDAQNNLNLFQTNDGGKSWSTLHPVAN